MPIRHAFEARGLRFVRHIHTRVRIPRTLRATSGFRCNANVKHSNTHPAPRACESEHLSMRARARLSSRIRVRSSTEISRTSHALISRPSYQIRTYFSHVTLKVKLFKLI